MCYSSIGRFRRRDTRLVFLRTCSLLSRLSLLAGHHFGPFHFGPESLNGPVMPSSRS